MKTLYKFFALAFLFFSIPATAGHLFTQASTNTPINVSGGQGIIVPQLAFESPFLSAGQVSLNFGGDWSSGDAIKITIASYTQDFSFDSPLAGTSQSGSSLNVIDPVLLGLALDLTAPIDWTFQATAGNVTWTGYRIQTAAEILDGTNAGLLNQSGVIIISGNEPIPSRAIFQSSHQAIAEGLDSIQLRLKNLRSGIHVNAANSMNSDDSAFHHEDDLTHQTGMSSGDDAPTESFWIRAFGGSANQDAKKSFAGYETDIYGISLGADTMLQNDWLVGGAFTYVKSDIDLEDFRSGDSADIDTYQLTAYATRDFKSDHKYFKEWYLEAMLAYAYQDYSTDRITGSGKADGDFEGDQFALRVVAGVPYDIDGYTVTPFGGFEVTYLSQDSYTESGPGALHVSSESDELIRSILGSRLSKTQTMKNGAVIEPSLHITWLHEFSEDGVNLTSTPAGGGSGFVTEGQDLLEDIFIVGAGIAMDHDENLSLSLQVDLEAGSGYDGYSAQAVGVWRF